MGVTTTCSVPMALFYKEPFNLAQKDMINIKVFAYNGIGDSVTAENIDTVKVQMPPTLPRPSMVAKFDTIKVSWENPADFPEKYGVLRQPILYVLSW